jgi:putative PIN family toxin of toxin-antitoxin system
MCYQYAMVIVVDTNVLVAGLRSGGGASRLVLRQCIDGRVQPIFGTALWLEYEDVLARQINQLEVDVNECQAVLAALAAAGQWVSIYFGWRPNLRDEADNHLVELAIAGGAEVIVTHNTRDFEKSEFIWQGLRILKPSQFLEEVK